MKENRLKEFSIKKHFTTYDIAQMLGITIQTVINWINKGMLIAETTLGGHRRIKKDDFIAFLKTNNKSLPKELMEGKYNVFIVDDEEQVLKTLSKVVLKCFPDFVVTTFNNGFDALLETGQNMPDILIIDIIMDGMDGFELIRRIRKYPEYNKISIIAISGKITEEEEKMILQGGASLFIRKPFNINNIKDAIEELIIQRKKR